MHKSGIKDGVHREIKDMSLDIDTVKLLKTQDMGYMVYKKAVDDRKIEKLRQNLHFIGEGGRNSHKIFVNSEQELENFDPAVHFSTPSELVDRAYNRPRTEAIQENTEIILANKSGIRSVKLLRKKSYLELQNRVKRSKLVNRAFDCLRLQRHLMGKGTKRKLKSAGDNGTPPVFKWKRERLR